MKRLRIIAAVVHAQVRLCEAGLPGAPGRLCGAARLPIPAPIEELRVRTFDTFQRHRTPREDRNGRSPSSTSTKRAWPKLGQWPWPRTRIADIITNLTRLGAVVIAFDVVFSEPDRLNPDVAADTFRNLDEETRAKLRALPSNDQVLADAIKQLARGARRIRVARRASPISTRTLPVTGLAMLGEEPQPFMFDFPGLLRNVPGAGGGGRRARPVHDQARARRHRPARADDHAGAGRDHAVAELRDAAGGDRLRHDPDQGRQGRHPEHRRQGLSDPDRSQRPALGSFRAQRSLDLCLGRRRARRPRAAGQDRAASWC